MDQFDAAILRELAANGRATQQELGEGANLSGNGAGRRQRALEDRGVITGYTATLDLEHLGFGTAIIVLIGLERQSGRMLTDFEDAVARCPSVVSCHLLSGSEDYVVMLRARDLRDFERIHRTELSQLPGIVRMQSLFSLREVVPNRIPPALFDQRPAD
jgi:DNA-binding Lrp family transcriptional regulator